MQFEEELEEFTLRHLELPLPPITSLVPTYVLQELLFVYPSIDLHNGVKVLKALAALLRPKEEYRRVELAEALQFLPPDTPNARILFALNQHVLRARRWYNALRYSRADQAGLLRRSIKGRLGYLVNKELKYRSSRCSSPGMPDDVLSDDEHVHVAPPTPAPKEVTVNLAAQSPVAAPVPLAPPPADTPAVAPTDSHIAPSPPPVASATDNAADEFPSPRGSVAEVVQARLAAAAGADRINQPEEHDALDRVIEVARRFAARLDDFADEASARRGQAPMSTLGLRALPPRRRPLDPRSFRAGPFPATTQSTVVASRPIDSSSSPASTPPPTADTVRLRPLTPAEREALVAVGACTRCRQTGHTRQNCPRNAFDPPYPPIATSTPTAMHSTVLPAPGPSSASTRGPPPGFHGGSRFPARRRGPPDRFTPSARRVAEDSSQSAALRKFGVLCPDFSTVVRMVDGREVPCVLDTGASVSLIAPELVSRLGLQTVPGPVRQVSLADGSLVKLGECANLEVQACPSSPTRHIRAYILPGVTDLLLSAGDLHGHAITLGEKPTIDYVLDEGADVDDGIDESEPVLALSPPYATSGRTTPRCSVVSADPVEQLLEPSRSTSVPAQTISQQKADTPQSESDSTYPSVSEDTSLTPSERCAVNALLLEFKDVFAPIDSTPARVDPFRLFLKPGATPVAIPPRRLSPEKAAFVESEVQRLLTLGIIRPSRSVWAAPLTLPPNGQGNTGFAWISQRSTGCQ